VTVPKTILETLTFAAAISSGLVAGVFFAFSNFVMAGLGRLAPVGGAAAMNSINVTVINPAFMLALFGTGLACLVLAAGAWGSLGQLSGKLALLASVLYVVGCVGVTMLCNVPLNSVLAAAQPGTPGADTLWSRYLIDWTMWNHVRTLASLLSAILFTASLLRHSGR
jgi:uncharacterized membrane protein